MKRFVAILLITTVVPLLLISQYYSTSSSLEKRFEQQTLYFSPSYINPYGVDEFSSALPGVIDHPLLNLQVNPASLSLPGNDTYFYVDYRTNKKLERYTDYIYPTLNSARSSFASDVFYPVPYYQSDNTKLSVEPAFSSAKPS